MFFLFHINNQRMLIELISQFLIMLFISVSASAGSIFLQFAYEEGNIFHFWIRFLDKYFSEDYPKNPVKFLYNPLGGCMYCQNMWIGLLFFSVCASEGMVSWWLFLPCLFFTHLSLSIIQKHLDR